MEGILELSTLMIGWGVTIGVLVVGYTKKKEQGWKAFWLHIVNPVWYVFYLVAVSTTLVYGVGSAVLSIVGLGLLIWIVYKLGGFG